MPYEELKGYVHLYTVFGTVMNAADAFFTELEIAGAIARRSPDGNLSSRDTDELITATSESQGKLAFTARALQFEVNALRDAHK